MTEPAATVTPTGRRWYQRVGPGLITACVVIGPGSILTSSKVGAAHGYGMIWVVVVAVLFMMVFMTIGARIGAVAGASPGTLIAQRAGRPLAVLLGLSVFFISAAFQFGNNLGVHSAFQVFFDHPWMVVYFNALSIAFLFAFKNLYRAVEVLMACFVGLMLLCFAVNLGFAGVDYVGLARGLIPGATTRPDEGVAAALGVAMTVAGEYYAGLDISVLGLVGTTFVSTAALYQAYLVQQKGWNREQIADGLRDARIGSVLMGLITLMLMSTAAAVLSGDTLGDVKAVARALEPLFGKTGKALFCLGLFSAAYSSFLVNSMIGGFILSDGLGLGSKPTDPAPRILTAVVLLTGMGVALFVIQTGTKPVPAIVAAQAITVLAAPLIGGALWWLANRRDVMGEDRIGTTTNIAAGTGFVLLLAMAWYTASQKVWPAVQGWLDG